MKSVVSIRAVFGTSRTVPGSNSIVELIETGGAPTVSGNASRNNGSPAPANSMSDSDASLLSGVGSVPLEVSSVIDTELVNS